MHTHGVTKHFVTTQQSIAKLVTQEKLYNYSTAVVRQQGSATFC